MTKPDEPFTTKEIEARLAQIRKQLALWSRDNPERPYIRTLELEIAALEALLTDEKHSVVRKDKWFEPKNPDEVANLALSKRLNKIYDENTRLRAALATSKSPCVYCQLPAEEWAKCQSGFPGCARADDASGCPEFGSMMENHDLRLAISSAIEKLQGHVALQESVPGTDADIAITTVIDNLNAAIGITDETTTV